MSGAPSRYWSSATPWAATPRSLLAWVVHAADASVDRAADPLGPGLEAIGVGGPDIEDDDDRLLERGAFIYDVFCPWCERHPDEPGGSTR